MKQPLMLLALAVALVLMVFLADTDKQQASAPVSATAESAAPAQSTVADDQIGQLVLARCTGCHSIQRLQQSPHDAAGWQRTVQRMEQLGVRLTPEEEPQVIDWLTRHFGR